MKSLRCFWLAIAITALAGCRAKSADPAAAPRGVTAIQKAEQADASAPDPVQTERPGQENRAAEKRFQTALVRWRSGDRKGALDLFEQACGDGLASACFRLGIIYRNGQGVSADEQKARSWFERACMLQSVSGCDALGH